MNEWIIHLGDGAYVEFDGFGYKIMANHHKHPTDTVFLEPLSFGILKRFVEECEAAKKGNCPHHTRISFGHSQYPHEEDKGLICVMCKQVVEALVGK